ncbi:S8 family serine peptidase [Anaeroselena agilis]|uniref:S8 family serine peptidase n=1 Tax=Anaeroselena agilis TaxID=3063788 RepID=A0ABU3P4G5_9FIRM|nr:S8 family serine peptidase [Selenomonadales bacterium 4137-cl]
MTIKWRRLLGVPLGLFLLTFVGSTAYCANPADFETPEYQANQGLRLIYASEAYALGYTGRGITLGIADNFAQLTHVEFANKPNSGTIKLSQNYNWAEYTHGTHVAGIMAADKNNLGMHGVAFEANLLSGDVLSDNQYNNLLGAYNAFIANSSIKIINNSWGSTAYYDVAGKAAFQDPGFQLSLDVLQNATNRDKVLVFAAGNSGHPTPAAESTLAYLRPQTAGNFINVISVNAANYNMATNTAGTAFVSEFSDLTKYVEENSIAAPGSNIYSSVSSPSANNLYKPDSGTSMAAPHVSGVAGLVQQAFPYMSGRQIVDTVLSTANRSFTLPDYTVTIQQDETPAGGNRFKVNLYYFRTSPNPVQTDLTNYYNANSATLLNYGYDTLNSFLLATRSVFYNVPQELVFGQGLLDAGTAVKGPGLLDARRLTASSLSTSYGLTQALYAVDTNGYDSTWSNDIGERRAGLLEAGSPYQDLREIYNYYNTQGGDTYSLTQGRAYIAEYNAKVTANGLKDLPVGLIKSGLGTLTLSGTNTYQGSTIAAGGILQLDGAITGDAWSVGSGTISGAGTIGGNLFNHSNIRAGSGSTPGTLRVNGNLASNRFISVVINSKDSFGKIAVAGTADINNSLLIPYTDAYKPDEKYVGILTAASGITGTFSDMPLTGFLTAVGSHDGTTATLQYRQENNLVNTTAKQSETYQKMIAIYNRLPVGSPERLAMYPLLNLNDRQATQALTEIYGGAQVNQAAFIQSDPTIGNAVSARMDYLKQPAGQQVSFLLPGLAPVGFTVNTVIPLELDAVNSWWMKASKNWGSIQAQHDLPVINNQGSGLVIGTDRKTGDNWRTGFLFGYSQNQVSSTLANTSNRGYHLGLYGGSSKGALDLQTYLDYGRQNNRASRFIRQLGLQADSSYNSKTLSFGIGASYNLHYDKERQWQVSPYADVHITRYIQDGYAETGAGDSYDQIADKLTNTYSTGELGIKVTRKLPRAHYALNVGYKRVLSGSNPEMTVAYTLAPADKIKISGSEQDREYLVVGLNIQGKLAKNVTIDGQITNEVGKRSDNLTASLMLRKVW